MSEIVEKQCLACGETFKGRGDKKFCSDQCRSTHNNQLNSDGTNYIRSVNNILRRNRRILKSMNPGGKVRVSQVKLRAEGFNFSYFTSTYITKDGATYYFCYDYGYLPIENDYYLLVIKQEYS